jgi:hypothetical protein
MPQAVPVAPTPAPISQFQDNAQSRLWYVGDRRGWGGRGWRHGGGWDDDWRWRHRRHRHDDDGAALALGLFGFATGALLGSQLHGGYSGYGGGYYGGGSCGTYDRRDAACDLRFRSYDWCSNTYMGYDGHRHYC